MRQRMHGLKLRKKGIGKPKAIQILNVNLSLLPVFVETSVKRGG